MATSTNTDQVAPRGALSTTDQLEPNSYADDPNDGVEADARAGSSDSYSLDASDPAPSGHEPATKGKDGLSEALKAERRRTNHLEKELRGVPRQAPWPIGVNQVGRLGELIAPRLSPATTGGR